jgi:hypothetical protein
MAALARLPPPAYDAEQERLLRERRPLFTSPDAPWWGPCTDATSTAWKVAWLRTGTVDPDAALGRLRRICVAAMWGSWVALACNLKPPHDKVPSLPVDGALH